jgi:hypothetical protein
VIDNDEQRLDLDAEIAERQQQHERPDRDSCHERDDAERAGGSAVYRQRLALFALERR